MNVHTAYWVLVVLAAIPLPLLLVSWFAPSASRGLVRKLLLIAATCSYIWLVLAMKFPAFLAESYSRGRFAIIDANFVVMVVCSVVAFRGGEGRKVVFGLACILTTLMWGVLGVSGFRHRQNVRGSQSGSNSGV